MNNPHIRVEYDLDYWGGPYKETGSFALVPISAVDERGTVEEAFKYTTGYDPIHIVYFCPDELVDVNGEFLT